VSIKQPAKLPMVSRPMSSVPSASSCNEYRNVRPPSGFVESSATTWMDSVLLRRLGPFRRWCRTNDMGFREVRGPNQFSFTRYARKKYENGAIAAQKLSHPRHFLIWIAFSDHNSVAIRPLKKYTTYAFHGSSPHPTVMDFFNTKSEQDGQHRHRHQRRPQRELEPATSCISRD
jgi:hypothetical protein